MSGGYTERWHRVKELLGEVQARRLRPEPLDDPKEVYAGNVRYRLGDLTVWVFNDCGAFDYLDSIEFPDGTRFDNYLTSRNPDARFSPEEIAIYELLQRYPAARDEDEWWGIR